MIGVIVVGHCKLSEELVRAAEFITGKIKGVQAVSLDPNAQVDLLRREVASAIEQVDSGGGILILADMFGGTPSNISLSFLEEGKVEVVTGVNLPMLIHIANRQSETPLNQLAEEVRTYGIRSISLAGEILKKEVS
jgi:PTS system mannose-specific IIA component